MRIGMLVNAASRSGRGQCLRPLLERHLAAHLLEVRQPSGPGETAAFARQLIAAGADTIVAVGGDGTVNAVINGIIGSGCRLGIIPAGTANDLAAGLDIPERIAEACATIVQGTARRIDLIRVNDWHYATAGGVGLPVDVIASVNRLRRPGPGRRCARLLGSGLYAAAMCCRLLRSARKVRRVDLLLDGRRLHLEVHALLVANLGTIGRCMRVVPHARPDDGRLDLFVLEASGTFRNRTVSALRTLNGSHVHAPCVRLLSGHRLVLKTDRPTPFCADGELGSYGTRFEIEVVPGALELLCPRAASPGNDPQRDVPGLAGRPSRDASPCIGASV